MKPKLKKINESSFQKCLENNEFYQVEITNNIEKNIEINDLEFNENLC